MAPEQAAADPNTDHRADIYAVGALAYEMLAGRPPFIGPSPQSVLAAHVTSQPDPVTKYRDSVPPALAALVMRCPAKHPADRFQSAGDVLEALEQMVARSTGRAAAPAGVQTWLTWRRALLGGGTAFGLLGVGTTVYTAMRLLGIGPVGTLVASGVLAERDRLVLADFENRTADSTLGPSLTEALRVDLAQSGVIRLLDAAAVGQALGRLGRAPGRPPRLAP